MTTFPLPSHVKTVNRRMKRFSADRWFDEKIIQLANGELIIEPNHHEMCGLLSENQRESLMFMFSSVQMQQIAKRDGKINVFAKGDAILNKPSLWKRFFNWMFNAIQSS